MSCTSNKGLLAGAIKDRGRLYLGVYREITRRHGEAEAESVMSSVSREIGLEVGRSMAHLGPRDFAGLLEAFFKAPDRGETFLPDVRRLDEQGLEVKMMACPLRESWVEAGCSDAEVSALLACATNFDRALYEAAGFDFDLETWSPGKTGCCRTVVREKKTA